MTTPRKKRATAQATVATVKSGSREIKTPGPTSAVAPKWMAVDLDNSFVAMTTYRSLQTAEKEIHKAHIGLCIGHAASNRIERAKDDLDRAEIGLHYCVHELLVRRPLNIPDWVSRVSACEGLVRMAMFELSDRLDYGDHVETVYDILEKARKAMRTYLTAFIDFASVKFNNEFSDHDSCNDWSSFAATYIERHPRK